MLIDPLIFRNEYFNLKKAAKLFRKEKIFRRKIEEYQPDLIGFSINSSNYRWAIDMASWIKTWSDCPIIIGGVLPTLIPDEVAANNCFDILCIGEGEEPLLALADQPRRRDIPGLWFRDDSGIIKNDVGLLVEDLDKYPMPDDDMFYAQLPWTTRYLADVIAGRGCPYSCSYCSNSITKGIYKGKGRFVRQRSVGHLMKELIYRKKKHRTKLIDFKNEIFAANLDWLKEFADDYKKFVNLPYYCYFNPVMANEQIVGLLKESGCRCVHFGLQNGSERIRSTVMNRKEKNETVLKTAKLCREHGIHFSFHCIMNLPGETEEDIIDSFKTYKEANPDDVSVYSLLYLPRSPIIQTAIAHGVLTEEDERKINSGLFNMDPRVLNRADKIEGRVDIYKKYAALFSAIPLLPKSYLDKLAASPEKLKKTNWPPWIIPPIKAVTLTRGGWGVLLPFVFAAEASNVYRHIKEALFHV